MTLANQTTEGVTMGQYHHIMNLTRHEYLNAEAFDEGRKLTEFGCGNGGTMAALAALLSASSGRGFGDFHTHDGAGRDNPEHWLKGFGLTAELADRHIVGRWAGDAIAIVGDYAQEEDLADWHDGGVGGQFGNDCGKWVNISWVGLVAIGLDGALRDHATAMLNYADDRYADGQPDPRQPGLLVPCPRPSDFVLFEGTATTV